MTKYEYVTLRENPKWKAASAEWFHNKWGVPEEAYLECMETYLSEKTEYGWYLCLDSILSQIIPDFTKNMDGSFCVWCKVMENLI